MGQVPGKGRRVGEVGRGMEWGLNSIITDRRGEAPGRRGVWDAQTVSRFPEVRRFSIGRGGPIRLRSESLWSDPSYTLVSPRYTGRLEGCNPTTSPVRSVGTPDRDHHPGPVRDHGWRDVVSRLPHPSRERKKTGEVNGRKIP